MTTNNRYECGHCGKVIHIKSDKAWLAQWCDKSQKNVHLMRQVKRGVK